MSSGSGNRRLRYIREPKQPKSHTSHDNDSSGKECQMTV